MSRPQHRSARLVSALVLGLLAGCQTGNFRAASLPAELMAPPRIGSQHIQLQTLASAGAASSSLSPDDLVLVRVTTGLEEKDREPHRLRVAADGSLDVPLIGRVAVAGLPPAEASRRIAAAAMEREIYRQPHVTLEVEERAVNRVMVMGAVANPGVHEIPRSSSDLVSALAAAGGLTEEADTNVEILRQSSGTFLAENEPPGGDIQQVSYQPGAAPAIERIDLAMNNAPNARPPQRRLGDRDVVMVPPRAKEVIHVAGLVRKPDQFALPRDQDIHVLDAVAMAGGLSSPVADKVYVIRQAPNGGQPAVIQVSIGKAKKDSRENLTLAPGDMVSVEQTMSTAVVGVAQSLVRVTLGATGSLWSF
ncbi:MAG: SLBB domain-containing protein [Planctomycetales bacterium]|nr:SLBB domain-containing protein [Planctomycetales bacterium]